MKAGYVVAALLDITFFLATVRLVSAVAMHLLLALLGIPHDPFEVFAFTVLHPALAVMLALAVPFGMALVFWRLSRRHTSPGILLIRMLIIFIGERSW